MNGKAPKKWAVFTPVLGAPSESFVTRHLLELRPGATVAVALGRHPECPAALADVPALILSEVPEVERAGILRRRQTRRDRIIRFLREHAVEAVLCEYLDFAVQYRVLVQNQGIRFVAHSHGYDLSRHDILREWGGRYAELNACAAVVAVSRFTRGKALEQGLDPARVHVIPCGVDVPTALREPPAAIRTLVSVGRLVPKKGADLVLSAFVELASDVPDLRWEIIGEGPLRDTLSARIAGANLADRIHLCGALPHAEVLRRVARADLFVQHSRMDAETGDMEGLPVAILEAMAQGLPVVATRHAGIPEVVRPGETGWLVDEGDSRGMVEAIRCAMQNPADCARMGANARRLVQDGYAWENASRRLRNLLEGTSCPPH